MVTGIPIFDAFGNIQYVISMMQDIQTFEDLYHSLLKEHKIINYDTKGPAVREKQDIVAKSPAFQQLLSVAANVASLDSTALLYGESGRKGRVCGDHGRIWKWKGSSCPLYL